jgi:hypothetical protein
MQPDIPYPLMWIPRYLQPRKHDLDALKRTLADLVQRSVKHRGLVYTVSSQAPETYQALKAASTSRLVILGEFSDRTIFGEPWYNLAQRAWHDVLHLQLSAGTDKIGEFRVAIAQANEAARLMGDTVADWILADLWGQTLHILKYGRFPIDQIQFTAEFVTTGRVRLF